jgi:hypothetical protein
MCPPQRERANPRITAHMLALWTAKLPDMGGRFAMPRLVDPACLVAVLLADRPVPGDIANGGHVP